MKVGPARCRTCKTELITEVPATGDGQCVDCWQKEYEETMKTKPDSHALDAPIHHVRDYKKIELTCQPDLPPPSQYRAHHDPEVVTCPDCLATIHREIATELERRTPQFRCSCDRADCMGDCPQSDMAFDAAREDRHR